MVTYANSLANCDCNGRSDYNDEVTKKIETIVATDADTLQCHEVFMSMILLSTQRVVLLVKYDICQLVFIILSKVNN